MRRSGLIILSALIVICGFAFANAVVWFVDFGARVQGDGSESAPFTGLWDALAVAEDGDTVRFDGASSQTYSFENPRITSALRLEAVGGPVSIGGPKPGDVQTIWLPGDVPLYMVWIPAGQFMMGRYPGELHSYVEEDPQHQVTLTSGFWMGKHQVTKRQWMALMETTPWAGTGDARVSEHLDSPVQYATYYEVQAFIAALDSFTGGVYRLPTEAEWEYACRAGTSTRFYWGDDLTYAELADYAWCNYNTIDLGEDYPHPVGLKLPNAWGLHDMSGNIWEVCSDCFGDYPDGPVTDPDGPPECAPGLTRVIRGGQWRSIYSCRSAFRVQIDEQQGFAYVGFRIAR